MREWYSAYDDGVMRRRREISGAFGEPVDPTFRRGEGLVDQLVRIGLGRRRQRQQGDERERNGSQPTHHETSHISIDVLTRAATNSPTRGPTRPASAY